MQRFQGLRRSPSRPDQLEPEQNDRPYFWFPVHLLPTARSMAFAGIRSGVLRSVAGVDGLAAAAAARPTPLLPRVHLAGDGTGK